MPRKKRKRLKPKRPGKGIPSEIPVEVQQTIFRIHLIDKIERQKRGFVRASRGLYQRLAKTFDVPHHAVERICCRLPNENQKVFKGIDAKNERIRMRARRRKYGYDTPDQT